MLCPRAGHGRGITSFSVGAFGLGKTYSWTKAAVIDDVVQPSGLTNGGWAAARVLRDHESHPGKQERKQDQDLVQERAQHRPPTVRLLGRVGAGGAGEAGQGWAGHGAESPGTRSEEAAHRPGSYRGAGQHGDPEDTAALVTYIPFVGKTRGSMPMVVALASTKKRSETSQQQQRH